MSPSVEEMRAAERVSEIALFTDYVGSGTEAARFIDYLCRNRSILSWASGKLVSFSVHSYAVSSKGQWRLEWHPRKPTIHWELAGLDFGSAGWTGESKNSNVKRLCWSYARRFRAGAGV